MAGQLGMDAGTQLKTGQKFVYAVFVVLLVATLAMSQPMPA